MEDNWIDPDAAKALAYSVLHTPHGMIVWGSVPVEDISFIFGNFVNNFPDSVIDFGLPSFYKCTMVVCRDRTSLRRWRAEVDLVLDAKYGHNPEERWLYGIDTGLSSICIFNYMKGYANADIHVPHDSDDFGRCYRLLDIIPDWRTRMPEMGRHYSQWKPFTDCWSELESYYRNKHFKPLNDRIAKLIAGSTGDGNPKP